MNPQRLRRNGGRLRRSEAVTVLSLLNVSFAWIGCAGEGTAPNSADRSTRNHAPRPEGQIPEVTQWIFGGPVDVAVSPYFSDPDGDSLEYEASWSDGRAVSLAQGFATVMPVAGGTATIRVTATDPAGLSALQTFDVRSVIYHTSAEKSESPASDHQHPLHAAAARGNHHDTPRGSFLSPLGDFVRGHVLIVYGIRFSVGRHPHAGRQEFGSSPCHASSVC